MDIEVILFDLGGVLVELSGVTTMMRWSRLDEPEIWRRWLVSTAVRKFESGRSTADEFASTVVTEFELDTTPQAFMEAFIQWPKGLYEGTDELLQHLANDYHLSCLSNTSYVHWQRLERETTLLTCLDSHFASFQIGLMKPDIEIYRHVISALARPADRILFFDDNQVNIDAARSSGMNALLAKGVGDVSRQLERLGLLDEDY